MEVAGIAPASEDILDKESFTCLAQVLRFASSNPLHGINDCYLKLDFGFTNQPLSMLLEKKQTNP